MYSNSGGGSVIWCFFDPWIRIRDKFFQVSNLGSWFKKKILRLFVNWLNFFLYLFKIKTILNFVKFMASKKFLLSLDSRWKKIRIRDKHP